MPAAVRIGVVGAGQRVFELPYPLAHLGDLTVKLFCVGEDESERGGRRIQPNREYCFPKNVGAYREP